MLLLLSFIPKIYGVVVVVVQVPKPSSEDRNRYAINHVRSNCPLQDIVVEKKNSQQQPGKCEKSAVINADAARK